VNADALDMLETVIRLIEVRRRAAALADLGGGAETRPAVGDILRQITDPAATDEEYRRCQYHAHILASGPEPPRCCARWVRSGCPPKYVCVEWGVSHLR
jgi:hypothetical protein